GADAFLASLRSLLDIVDNAANRVDEILALRPDGFLTCWTNFGTARAGGGAYERPFLLLQIFGPDGHVVRGEQFDPDCDHEALARFDELTAEPAAARFAGAPSRAAE